MKGEKSVMSFIIRMGTVVLVVDQVCVCVGGRRRPKMCFQDR